MARPEGSHLLVANGVQIGLMTSGGRGVNPKQSFFVYNILAISKKFCVLFNYESE
jgi:hypothetical protein